MRAFRKKKRETTLIKEFYRKYDDCETKNELCRSLNCDCGRKQRRKWLEKQIQKHFEPEKYYTLTICPKWDECDLFDLLEFNEISSAKYLSNILKSLKIPGFRGAFFLDIEKEDRKKGDVIITSIWHLHWYGLVKANLDEKTLRSSIAGGFESKKGFQTTKLNPVITKPYNYSYPLKLIKEHKSQTNLIPYGRIKSHRVVNGRWLGVLREFYKERNIENCMFFIGFRRNGNALIQIKRQDDKPVRIQKKLKRFKKLRSRGSIE